MGKAVSIPYSTIKIRAAKEVGGECVVSIPYSTIKILPDITHMVCFYVSIPYSTIKIQLINGILLNLKRFNSL